MKKTRLLRLAGLLSLLIALFQGVISFSPSWSLFFGAPLELVSNIPGLIITGLTMTAIFVVFGLYGFSGAGDLPPLPLLRVVLLIIGSVYTIRGLLLILQILTAIGIVQMPNENSLQLITSSAVSLIIGVIYLLGTLNNREILKIQTGEN